MGYRPSTSALLSEVKSVFCRYVALPGSHFFDVAALWVLHSWAIEAAETTPRLLLKSPEKECGKTRMLEVLEALVAQPQFTLNISPAYLFRRLVDDQPTLLFDEVDAIFGVQASNHEDLRALLNAGYRRGAMVGRASVEGKKIRTEEYPVFAATALASKGSLPDTIESRAIVIPMRRRAPTEQVAQFRFRRVKEETAPLRDDLSTWAGIYTHDLAESRPEMPDGVTDRAADCWEPLLAISDLADAEWAQRARAAAVAIVGGRVAEDASLGVRLLADIKTALHGRMSTVLLLAKLNALEESGWGGWHGGQGMNARDLAKHLKPYGVSPKALRLDGGEVVKGYDPDDLQDAWARYLRDSSAPIAVGGLQRLPGLQERDHVTDVTEVTAAAGWGQTADDEPVDDRDRETLDAWYGDQAEVMG